MSKDKTVPFIFIAANILFLVLMAAPIQAKALLPCHSEDKICLLEQLETLTGTIDNTSWKDQTYREVAKLLAKERQSEKAIKLIEKIQSPDTKAMTIRGIGMAAAKTNLTKDEYDALFITLRAEAEKIEHPPSYAIALTYITMAQAFSGDDEGAMKTAMDMKNEALRNKALSESAEIQAEQGNLSAATNSIAAIESPAFRDKARRLISKIFSDKKKYNEALKSAMTIENSYQKAQAILYILAKQITPKEVSLVK